MFRNFIGKFMTALLISAGVVAPAAANAAAWDGGDWPKQVEGRVIEYRIITANYQSPRDLATAIQEATRNPILLLPPVNAEQQAIYLILPDGKAPAKLDPDQFSACVSALNPKRIVIIGDETIVPNDYRLAIDRKYEIIDFASKSWFVNAVSAANLFNSDRIKKDFEAKRNAEDEVPEVDEADAAKAPAEEK